MSVWHRKLGFWYIADDHPDALAIAHSPQGEFTFRELAESAHQSVHGLRSLGLEEGAVIAVLASNGIVPVQFSLACQEAGWYLMLVNGYSTSEDVASLIQHSDAEVLVVDEAHAHVLQGATGDSIRGMVPVLGVGEIPTTVSWHDVIAAQPTSAPERRSTGGMIAYSSGTTGQPKGVIRKAPEGDPAEALRSAADFGRAFDFRPLDGPHLVSTAMYHGGSHSFYMGALNVGHALVIMDKFDPEAMLALIEAHQVRTAYMVTTQFHRLLRLPEALRGAYDVSSLHAVVHSAAPCPVPLKLAMFEWWGPVIWETYGGMEGAATIAKPHRWLEKPGTVGRAVRGVQLAIFDDDGKRLEPGQTGHIYFKTSTGFEYHRDSELTAEAHRGNMFTIGDIGYIDSDGYLFIQDRAKDTIISGGVNIYPAEIEGVLLEHASVDDVAVIGVPDDDWGEGVLAVVVPRDGLESRQELEQSLIRHCGQRLAPYKRPSRFEFRSGLPRSGAGKLYKREIREQYWENADERFAN